MHEYHLNIQVSHHQQQLLAEAAQARRVAEVKGRRADDTSPAQPHRTLRFNFTSLLHRTA